jgi:hypothetical protein
MAPIFARTWQKYDGDRLPRPWRDAANPSGTQTRQGRKPVREALGIRDRDPPPVGGGVNSD